MKLFEPTMKFLCEFSWNCTRNFFVLMWGSASPQEWNTLLLEGNYHCWQSRGGKGTHCDYSRTGCLILCLLHQWKSVLLDWIGIDRLELNFQWILMMQILKTKMTMAVPYCVFLSVGIWRFLLQFPTPSDAVCYLLEKSCWHTNVLLFLIIGWWLSAVNSLPGNILCFLYLSLACRDCIGDCVLAGDLRWAGTFGVNLDFVARSHCSVDFISIEDMQVNFKCHDFFHSTNEIARC